MQTSTTKKQKDTLNTQNNVEENQTKENSTLIERKKIPGTPFTLIKSEEKWFMVMGDYRVTETTNTEEEQLEKLNTEKWLLIMHIAIVAVHKINNSLVKEIDILKDKLYTHENKVPTYETESL